MDTQSLDLPVIPPIARENDPHIAPTRDQQKGNVVNPALIPLLMALGVLGTWLAVMAYRSKRWARAILAGCAVLTLLYLAVSSSFSTTTPPPTGSGATVLAPRASAGPALATPRAARPAR